jgi:hypothetical protein
MTEKITNEQHPLEIQFGDSAKWHIVELCKGNISIADAANSLQFLITNINKVDGRETFISDLKAFVLRSVAANSNKSEESVLEQGNKLFENLVAEMKKIEEGPDFTRRFGTSYKEIENRVDL